MYRIFEAMKTYLINGLMLACILLFVFSCSSDEGPSSTEGTLLDLEDIDTPVLSDDSNTDCINSEVFNDDFVGTACCVQRLTELNIGGKIEYAYFTNLEAPTFEWSVRSGDIEIASGARSNVVSIRLGESFSGGEIYILGTGTEGLDDGLVCGQPISIVVE